MGWANKLIGWTTNNGVEVDATNRLLVNLATSTSPTQVGAVRVFSEVDPGAVTGTALLYSPEVDDDYRLRVNHETLLDSETFNYTAQNTGKHNYHNTTMSAAWTATGFQTNSGSITTLSTGVTLTTGAYFPMIGVSNTYMEFEASVNNSPIATHTQIDFGLGLLNVTIPYAFTDGAYFRLTSGGMYGVINFNTTETTVGPFLASYGGSTWQPTANTNYQYIISIDAGLVTFWIDDVKYGSITTPAANGQPFQSAALPVGIRHVIDASGATGTTQFLCTNYTVSYGGPITIDTLGSIGNRMYGSYQGLSGGAMGGLATYANSANPGVAVPTNTSLVTNLLAGLGGQCWESCNIALNTDGIIMDYTVPAGTVSVPGKRLKINGIFLSSAVVLAISGGPVCCMWSLAFGHTAVSLATAEAATTKAPRRIPLSAFTQAVTLTQAISTLVTQPGPFMYFQNPIYVNPGEHIALVKKVVGAAALTTGTFAHQIAFDYSWE